METILNIDKVLLFLGVFLAVSIVVITAIMLDLWDGVHTAKKTHERVHSHRLRVTIAKISEYWRLLLIGFLIDCLGVLFDFYFLPFVALLFGAGLIVVEAKSMFEHASKRKSHAVELPEIISKIVSATTSTDARKIIDTLKENPKIVSYDKEDIG